MLVALDVNAFMPDYAHDDDAGMDLRSPIDTVVPPLGSVIIDTGVHIGLHKGYVGFIKSKSGLNVKHNLTSEGVIDCGYTGSIVVKLYNHGTQPYNIKRGDKISQLVVFHYSHERLTRTDSLEETERGDNGFGSTGR